MTPEVKAIVDEWWAENKAVAGDTSKLLVCHPTMIHRLATRIEATVLAKQPTPTAGGKRCAVCEGDIDGMMLGTVTFWLSNVLRELYC